VLLLRLLNSHISLPFSNLSTGLKSTNALNKNFFLLPTKLLQPVKISQPSYLNNLIFVQPPRSTRSSSVVTIYRPSTISSLKITDRLFRYASPRLWNQLPDSFRQPRQSCLDSPSSSFPCQLISIIITTLIIHHSFTLSLQAQNLPFQQILPTLDFFYLYRTAFMTTGLDRTYHAHRFIFSFTF